MFSEGCLIWVLPKNYLSFLNYENQVIFVKEKFMYAFPILVYVLKGRRKKSWTTFSLIRLQFLHLALFKMDNFPLFFKIHIKKLQ